MRRLIFFAVLILCCSCEPGDLVNLPSAPSRITVVASNVVGQPWVVFVAPSRPNDLALQHRYIPRGIPDATVKIYEDGNFVEQLQLVTYDSGVVRNLSDAFASMFQSKINSPKAGHDYKITVESKDYPPVTATYKQPEPVPADISFEFREVKPYVYQVGVSDGTTTTIFYDTAMLWTFDVAITFTDPPGDNYYDFWLNTSRTQAGLDSSGGYFLMEEGLYKDPVLEGGSLKDDKTFAGQRVTFKFLYAFQEDSTPYYVSKLPNWFRASLRSMSEGQYKSIIQTRKSEVVNFDPYAQPITTFTNVENGVGIFGGYTPSSKDFYFKSK
jgi:hypothetical protein